MTHDDSNGFLLSYTIIAEVAHLCNSFSKELYFREQEYLQKERNSIDCLIELYKELGLKESANYLTQTKNLELNDKNDKIPLISVYEKHEWGVVLEIIEKKMEERDDSIDKVKSNKIFKMKNKTELEIYEFGARAAFHLKKWDHLDNFTREMEEGVQKEFYNSILHIKNKNFPKAENSIRKFRKKMVEDFGSFGDYMGSYDKIMKMHQIMELEEIVIALKERQEINTSSLYDFMLGSEQKRKLIKEKKTKILHKWEDRISLVENNIDYWEMIISIRSLFASDSDLIRTRFRFGKLCKKLQFMNLFKSTLQFLIGQKQKFQLKVKKKVKNNVFENEDHE